MPTTRDSEPILTPRDREILRDVIRTFISTGEPVSSRSVAKHDHGVSSATIRNVMADLEDLGYLSQPHTSAGRVPTEDGYHFYIDSLMRSRAISERERAFIDAELAAGAVDGDRLMASASQLLSQLSHQIGIVQTPSIAETVLKSISFVPLSGRKVLCVVVSANGFVDNKLIETAAELSSEDLLRISNYVTDNFAGLTVRQIRDRLIALMAEERARVDQLLATAIELSRNALDLDDDQDVIVEGTSSLLSQPELANLERVQRLLDAFADRAGLVQLLNQVMSGRGVRVLIGQDSDLTRALDFSLVATTYGVAGKPLGTLGVFGPSRMPYPKLIPLVAYFGERLGRALEDAYGEST